MTLELVTPKPVTPRTRLYNSNAEKQAAYRKRKRVPALFRRDSDEWETPPAVYAALDAEFGFTLDVAATPENTKCERFITPKDDALRQKWEGVCWLNPPFGSAAKGSQTQRAHAFARWIQKAHESAAEGATVVALLPARTDTHWWHDHVLPFAELRYIRGRIKFWKHGAPASSATHPSVLAIFRPKGEPQ